MSAPQSDNEPKDDEQDLSFNGKNLKVEEIPHPNFYYAKTYAEAQDPMISILRPDVPEQKTDLYGYIVALDIKAKSFVSYEVYIFIEENLKLEVDEVTIFRTRDEKPSGIVIARLKQKIFYSKLNELNQIPFKGKPVSTKLFATPSEFQKFAKEIVREKLKDYSLPLRKTVPLVYVSGFSGSMDDVKAFFGQVGKILLVEQILGFFVIYFAEESSARNAARTYNLYGFKEGEIRVTLFYNRALDRSFGVRHCPDYIQLLREIKNYGKIEHHIMKKDGTIYVLMESQENSKNACIALNSMRLGNSRIQTFFIRYMEYNQIANRSQHE